MKIMRSKNALLILGIVLTLFSLFPSFRVISQTIDNSLSGWDKDALSQANTAANVSYLSDEEKKLIFYTNLCRLKPKLFCQTVLGDYLKAHPNNTPQVASLKRELNTNKGCGALVPDEELYTIARDFATKMGIEGKEGHVDFQKRVKPLMSRYNRVGENCDYGDYLALDAFMDLLIDSDDPINLGHRKNILDPKFTDIGVSGQTHKTFRWNYVMDFAGLYEGN